MKRFQANNLPSDESYAREIRTRMEQGLTRWKLSKWLDEVDGSNFSCELKISKAKF